jgi:hypothetical protein
LYHPSLISYKISSNTVTMVNVPNIKLNSGFDMPQIGFGLWKVEDNCAEVVYNAIKAGYRLLDGACGMCFPLESQSQSQLSVWSHHRSIRLLHDNPSAPPPQLNPAHCPSFYLPICPRKQPHYPCNTTPPPHGELHNVGWQLHEALILPGQANLARPRPCRI